MSAELNEADRHHVTTIALRGADQHFVAYGDFKGFGEQTTPPVGTHRVHRSTSC